MKSHCVSRTLCARSDTDEGEKTNLSTNSLEKRESRAECLQPSIVLKVQVSTDRSAAAEETNSEVGDGAVHIVDNKVAWQGMGRT